MDENDKIIEGIAAFFPMFRRIFMKMTGENGNLAHSQYPILGVLMKRGQTTMSEMGEILSISKPNMSVLVDRLIEEKKIKRIYDENDRRVIKIEITEKGREFMKKARESLKEDFKSKLSGLTDEEKKSLSNSLENIKKIMAKINCRETTG